MTDAVVIGSGPNGLVAANLLADRGWSVAVFEAEGQPGGAVRSSELIEPGFTNDLFSSFYPLSVASPVMRELDLEQHGLRWCRSPIALAHPTSDGVCPVIAAELDETVDALNQLTPGDGDAWRSLFEQWLQVGDAVLGAMFTPFPPVRAGLKLALSMKPAELVRFVRFSLLPVRRMGEEEFMGEPARRLFAGNALHADFGPEAALSGFFGWMLCCMAQQYGFPVPQGGAGQLVSALIRRLEALDGYVQCGSRVRRVIIRGGRAVAIELEDGTEVDAPRGVLADVSATKLFGGLVHADELPDRFVADLRRSFQWDLATVKVDWNLDGPIPWEAEPARRSGTVHVADSVDALTLGAAQLATGQIPNRPFLLVGQQSMTDPTRQPAGKETAWAYTHVPQDVRSDARDELTGKWDDAETDRFAARVEDEIERLAPGFKALVRGRHVFTPKSIEARDANLVGGAVNGGTAQLHQQLVFRPTPGLGRAETPVPGLFLASASAHPGGGVHGACGANAARAAVFAQRRRLRFR